jgi:plasmid stabilization system protein ParE
VITRRKTVALAVVAVLTSVAAVLAATPGPASADASTFRDRRFDTRHPADIVAVKVEHAERIVVVVRHRNLTFRDAPASLRLAYDTGPRFDGPEFWLRIAYQSDQTAELRATRGWARPAASPIPTCRGERASVSASNNTTRVSVPRSCFGNPRSVRVHARVDLPPRDHRAPDVAPRSRTLGPPVRM